MNRINTADRYAVRPRNKKALSVFTHHGLDVRITGDDESPMFIFEDSILLSCFVNGSKLFFRSTPDSANIIHSIDLNQESYISSRELTEILERSEHLPMFRVQDQNSGLYLVGFNYLRNEEGETTGRFPVFAKHRPFVYVNRSKAEEIAENLQEAKYNVEVI